MKRINLVLMILLLFAFSCDNQDMIEPDIESQEVTQATNPKGSDQNPTLSGCVCSSPNYICWYYAMKRAGYTSSNTCPNAISQNAFTNITVACMTDADIIDFGSHAGYIASVNGSNITVEDFNHSGSCATGTRYYSAPNYSDPQYGNAVKAWKRRPGNPTLFSPSNGASVANPVELDWGSNADSYWLQVSSNAQFTAIVHEEENLSSSQETLPSLSSGTYYWRVKSRRGPYCGVSVYSPGWSSRSFVVQPACASINTPTISGTTYNGHPKIYWSSISGAEEYKIYKRTGSPSGSYYLVDTTTQTSWVDNYEDIYSGNGEKQYVYYKIKAVNSGPNCSPPYTTGYSNYQQFTVEQPVW